MVFDINFINFFYGVHEVLDPTILVHRSAWKNLKGEQADLKTYRPVDVQSFFLCVFLLIKYLR